MEKTIKKNRDSNIELLRIIAMCLIIFHHMALNTGIVDGYTVNGNMIFGIIGGIGGKIGVVIFLLITGYFSINKNFSFKKVFILWLQIFCYSVGFMLVFRLTGIEKWSKVDTIKTFFPLAYNQYWFITVYLYILLLAPFINKFLNSLSKENYNKLLAILTVIFAVIRKFYQSTWENTISIDIYSFFSGKRGKIRCAFFVPFFNKCDKFFFCQCMLFMQTIN